MASYTTEVAQSLPFGELLVGQELIVGLSNDLCVTQEQNVKFCFNILVGDTFSTTASIGTFKTTPNNAGVGLLDINRIIENYVAADNIASKNAEFKRNGANDQDIPIHLIDYYSRSKNAVKVFSMKGYTEFTNGGQIVQTDSVTIIIGIIINGYVKHADTLKAVFQTSVGDAYGFSYSLEDYGIAKTQTKKFLTNSPSTQYVRAEDYCTLPFLAISEFSNGSCDVDKTEIKMYNDEDSTIGTIQVTRSEAFGAFSGTVNVGNNVENRILYIGVGPANLKQDTTFNVLLESNLAYYTITLLDAVGDPVSETKRFDILCPNLKQYKPIRLTWLNQFGTWDYYTFNQKSVKSISTKSTTYQQLGGTWNSKTYNPYGYKGGTKTFRVNASEKIRMNTDYITEEHSDWFEELVNSPEVYMLKDWELPRIQSSVASPTTERKVLNQEVTPVRLTTTNFTKKTVANDKLIQYTFEVEKSKNLRTQAI
tara:strand:+ start:4257 stop:5696 length:1440 start_codon:yes stop_codon:yes gene_type:complete